jgi:hypothetical protein
LADGLPALHEASQPRIVAQEVSVTVEDELAGPPLHS